MDGNTLDDDNVGAAEPHAKITPGPSSSSSTPNVTAPASADAGTSSSSSSSHPMDKRSSSTGSSVIALGWGRTPRFDLTPMTALDDDSRRSSYVGRGMGNDGDSDNDNESDGGPSRRRRDPRATCSEDDDDDSDYAGSANTPPPSTTPTLNESYDTLRKTLSFKSLRELELRHVQKAAWRRKGEPRKRPRDLEQLLVYALTGGARAFTLAYVLRSGINLLTTFIRLLQRRKLSASLLLRAIFAREPVRFGTMFGSYVFIWKMAIHLLRLYNPGSKGHRRIEYWHAPLAGALSGLAVLAETKNSRIGIAQQLLVRGLQGWYNILHKKNYINIPNGEILLFGAACGQIMYSWLAAPEALNPGYSHWITNASHVPPPILPWALARHRHTDKEPPLTAAHKLLTWRNITPGNATRIEHIIERVHEGDYGVAFPACELVHPWADSCIETQVLRAKDVFFWISPVYAALHFIPPILFKRKQFVKEPLAMLLRSIKGTARSSAFLSTFVVIFQSLVCFRHQTWWFGQTLSPALQRIWLSKLGYWAMGFATCLSLFVEAKKRRGELAMYVMPKALESAWSIARRRAWVPFIPGGEVLLTSAAMSMVMSTYQHEPQMLSGLVRTIVYQFAGMD